MALTLGASELPDQLVDGRLQLGDLESIRLRGGQQLKHELLERLDVVGQSVLLLTSLCHSPSRRVR